jgi:hypothetical protein
LKHNPIEKIVKNKDYINKTEKNSRKQKREQSMYTSQIPLTRYPKKNPDEQMRNCCHLGLSESEIPNKLRPCSSFFIISLPFTITPSNLEPTQMKKIGFWNKPRIQFNRKIIFLKLKVAQII